MLCGKATFGMHNVFGDGMVGRSCDVNRGDLLGYGDGAESLDG